MGQCYPSKTCQRSSFSDHPVHHSLMLTGPKHRRSSARRPHHSYPPQNFQTMYRRSHIVNKQLFLNSGFVEDDYIYSPYHPEPSNVSEERTTYRAETSANPSVPKHRVISATFAYSGSAFSIPARRLNSDTSVPKLVFDVTDRTNSTPNCTTFITVTSGTEPCVTSESQPFMTSPDSSPRTLAEDHVLPIVTRVSLDSLVTDDIATPNNEMGRISNDLLQKVAYF